jgi:hypothetical protein
MKRDIYYAITLPWQAESMLGFTTAPGTEFTIIDNHTGETTEHKGFIVSIGLIFFRIDIVI